MTSRSIPTSGTQDSEPRRLGAGGRAARSLWLVIAPLIALALALLFLLSSGDITGREAAYPRGLAVVVALLAIVSLWSDSVEARRDRARTDSVPPTRSVDDEPEDVGLEGRRGAGLAVGRVVAFVAVTSVGVYLMGPLGFFVAGTLLVGGGLVVLGVRSPWRVIAYTAGLITVAYFLFVEALRVPFPPAPWS